MGGNTNLKFKEWGENIVGKYKKYQLTSDDMGEMQKCAKQAKSYDNIDGGGNFAIRM